MEVADDCDFAEKDPSGRYIRYDEILGQGAFKTVYKGFDEVDGIEIAWNQINIEDVFHTPEQLERLYSEIHLLNSLKHENIIKVYNSWMDEKNKTMNIITELFTSGSLRLYRNKHRNVDMKAIKNWARQILKGLHYLHSHNPPIIHRDLKCDNVFVNGNNGVVKIGDLGLAIVLQQPTAHSLIGTPEFMAPELYDEEYNELVDIYSFGMCMLEMISCEYPYSECRNPAQRFKKVTCGIKPSSLAKVSDVQIKEFIEKCLLPASMRPPAMELLKDPFLLVETPKDLVCGELQFPNLMPELVNIALSEPHPMDVDPNCKKVLIYSSTSLKESPQSSTPELQCFTEYNEFKLKGNKNDDTTISLTLRIVDRRGGGARNIEFSFYFDSDTALSIAMEMVEQLQLSNEDVAVIAELIDGMIVKVLPCWKPSSGTTISCLQGGVCCPTKATIDVSEQEVESDLAVSGISAGFDGMAHSDGSNNQPMESSAYTYGDWHKSSSSCGFAYVGVYDSLSQKEPSNEKFLTNCCSFVPRDMSLSSIFSLSLADNHRSEELKLELDTIESQYHQCFQGLTRMREKAIQNAKKKWITNNKVSVM